MSIELISHYSANSFNLKPEAGGGTGTVVTDPATGSIDLSENGLGRSHPG